MEALKSNLAMVFAVALAAMITTALAASLLSAQRTISSSGSVIRTVDIRVYRDSGCTQSLDHIDWGLVEVGGSRQQEIWIKNTGNTRVKLNMTTEGWNPSEAKNHITITWDREGKPLNASQLIKATLTLTVLTSVTQTSVKNFSFTIIITGIEY